MKDTSPAARRFTRFLLFAIAAMFINLASTNLAGYADSFTNTAYGISIALLFAFLFLYQAGRPMLSLMLSTLLFNLFFTVFSYLYGMSSLICAYYFPFLISFIYMFKDQCTRSYAYSFFAIYSLFLTALLIFCPMEPALRMVTEDHISLMYRKNLALSFLLSSYYFTSIFSFMIGQNQNMKTQKELAEEGSRSKARFLSVMSHELRTPLNGIVGVIHLMDGPISGGEQKKYLQILKTSAHHLLHLVNNVLDYSKASAGKMELNPVACRLDEVVRNVYSVFQPRFVEKGIDLFLQIDPAVHARVLVDEVRIVQVLTNLLSNGLKFTEAGHVALEVSCLAKTTGAIEVACRVSDTGPGISAEQKKHLFDSFNNISNKARGIESTGLGLAISQMIVQEMGGKLSLESEPGTGSVFSITLRLPLLPEEAPETQAVTAAETAPLRGIRVLIAEDNPVNMMIARSFLKKWQIEILEAVDGGEAVKLLQEKARPDLVLLDLHMPNMDGYEVMDWIRAEGKDVPVIAFTASMLASAEIADLSARGFINVVPKPFSPTDLEGKMKEALLSGRQQQKKLPYSENRQPL